MRRRLVLLGALVVVAVLPHAGAGAATPLLVGFSDVAPEFTPGAGAAMTQLGAGAVRFTLAWSPGTTTFGGVDKVALDAGIADASGLRVVLAVYGSTAAVAPATQAARSEYCAYVADVVRQEPRVRDVVIWNEPNKAQFWSPQAGAPAAYEALLAQCYDALHAYAGMNVLGLALSHNGNDDASSTSPGAFIRAVGTAYRASGRAGRILDTVAFHPYPSTTSERPWRKHVAQTTIAEGDWNKLMYNLSLAFAGTGQPIPGNGDVTIWYTEDGFQSTVPAAKAALYTGMENVATLPEDAGGDSSPAPAEDSPAPDQATQIRDAVALARCQPYVAAFFNFLVVDEIPLAGWQSGPLYPDRTRKASYAAFASAFSSPVDCAALKGGPPSADYLPPGAPSPLTAAAAVSPLRVELTWGASTDAGGGPLTYWVYRDGARIATTTARNWSDANVASRRTYTYAVRAIDAASNLGDAATTAVTTPDVTPPTAPAGLSALVAPGGVQLSWSAATDDAGVAGYDVTRAGSLLGSTAGTSFTDAVGPGSYTYAVAAFDAAGNRGPATTAAVTVAAPPAGGGGGGGGANLAVTLAAAPSTTVPAGAEVDLTATVANHGAAGSLQTHLVLALPDGATLLGAPSYEAGSGCTGTRTLDCFLDYVPNAGATHVRLAVRLAAGGNVSAQATADGEVDPSDNTATLALTATATAPPPVLTPRPLAVPHGRTIVGTARDDHLRGTPYADVLNGRGGRDVIVGGLGADTLIGGPGDDRLQSADGVRDVLDCGRGRDTVVADARDRVSRSCEVVRRVRS
jgi:hypothetical protein